MDTCRAGSGCWNSYTSPELADSYSICIGSKYQWMSLGSCQTGSPTTGRPFAKLVDCVVMASIEAALGRAVMQ